MMLFSSQIANIKVLDESSLMIGEGQGSSNSKSVIVVNDPVYFEPVYQNNPYMPMHFILMTIMSSKPITDSSRGTAIPNF